MQPSSRLDRLPPYLFAELERKIREKRAAGVDVISLGIGDPDTPTPQPVIDALAAAAADPGTHQYPSNRGRPELREAFARFYERRFGVTLDPESEIIPALGAKECVFNLNLAFLDPDSVALAADPGYPVYTGGPLLAGAEAVLMPLLPERGFAPDLDAIGGDVAERARLLYLNYPNNPTGAIVPDGLFERAVEFGREHDVLIVHDASYTETTFDGYVAPSFLETPGAKEVGVEVFSLSKGWNMTGWRTAAIVGQRRGRRCLLEAEDEHRLGHVRGGAACCGRPRSTPVRRAEMSRDLPAPSRPRLRRARRDRRGRDPAEGHDLRLGAGAGGAHLGVLLRAGARGVGRGRLARRLVRPERRGLLPHLAHRARRATGRGRGAPAREPRGARRALLRHRPDAARAPTGDARGGTRTGAADPAQRDLLRAWVGRAGGGRAALAGRGGGRRGSAALGPAAGAGAPRGAAAGREPGGGPPGGAAWAAGVHTRRG